MAWPTIGEYNAAFANPRDCLRPPLLALGRARAGPLGAPMPISGGFAYIYELILPDGTRRAVRCFAEDDPERRERAASACLALGEVLAARPGLRPHFAEAEWVDDCVEAGGWVVPALVMEWIEGLTLGQYLEARHGDGAALARLRADFAGLVRELASAGVVHGDLQTGNIIIERNGVLRLLDYDGLAVGGGDGRPGLETGHVNFQHPDFGASSPPWLKDRFPSIVIDLGLAALAAKPGLFATFSTGENVLLSREDFGSPADSGALAALRATPALARAAELLALLCRAPVEALPSLDEFLLEAGKEGPLALPAPGQATGEAGEGAGLPPAAAKAGSRKRKVRAPYAGQYEVHEGDDYAGILGAVGRKVEVVGRVVSVKTDGVTKHGDPYSFVNFGDWRREGFKLAIWSEGLATFSPRPNPSWEGRWVSAVGLVDEPYTSRYGVTQLSITIQDSSQLRFIAEAEARYRLGGPAPRSRSAGLVSEPAVEAPEGAARPPPSSNEALLGALGAARQGASSRVPSRSPAGAATSRAPVAAPSNRELLAQLGKSPAAGLTGPGQVRPPVRSPSPPAPAPPPPAREPSGCRRAAVWAGLILAAIVLYSLLRS